MIPMDDPTASEAFDAWWPTHAVRHNSRSPVAAREAFMAGWRASREQWTGDSVPALLTPGGAVVTRQQAEALGLTVEAKRLPDEKNTTRKGDG